MRIVIDGRMLNESGIGRYIRNLINNLAILDKESEYFILHLKEDYKRLKYKDNFNKVLANFPWYGFFEQIKLPGLIKSLNPDLVHFPHFNVPVCYRGKFVVTIHDLIHQRFRMKRATTLNPLFYQVKQFGYTKVFKNAARKSDKILVPSNYVKDLLQDRWEVEGKKVVITHEAVDDKIFLIKNAITKKEIDKAIKKFSIKLPFIFYVGNAHPHKNVEGLIRAFKDLEKKHPDLSLVLSGSDHYFWRRLKEKYPGQNIIYTGYISDKELVALYKRATAFIMPSLEEGFGIPILEAMACGTLVVSSNKGSLIEVGGDAAFYFDPTNPGDMTAKVLQILDDKKLRQKLIEKGLKRCKEFSWKRLAQQTLETYKQCV
ncbi:glycosyltransferase family 4 protein [Patescibacteria group bacterium]|nr:glycosyltransferase family 4 protein [Patescibacteria group bacterium]